MLRGAEEKTHSSEVGLGGITNVLGLGLVAFDGLDERKNESEKARSRSTGKAGLRLAGKQQIPHALLRGGSE
jgi:hypothetical protein